MARISRRIWLTGTAIGASQLLLPHTAGAHTATAKILDTKVISWQPEFYKGWPTVARRQDGELLLVWSGGRESHICPFGQVKLMRSHDGGQSWTWPTVVLDGPIDDRDAGVMETANNTILVTSFSSLAYVPSLEKAEKASQGEPGSWDPARLRRWKAAHGRVSAEQRQAALGVWMTRSTDGGLTWSRRYACCVDSPHGPIQLRDGRLLYAGKELWHGQRRVGVCQSNDDGQSWQWLATIPTRDDDTHADYHELHAVEAQSGRIVVQIRNHNRRSAGETLQTESDDGGKTWSTPHTIGVWGLPSHLLRLADGRLLMTYGYRREPFGNQARLSIDEGRTWSQPMPISSDGTSGDLGYPSTVELADRSLLTVWYERMKDSPKAALRQARWQLD